ncbi:MAG: transcription-repair coupling factor, partial [Sphingobacteriales bacterium]
MLRNLKGSSANFIASAVWQQAEANHVFVLNDREEAAYFHNDLESLTNALDICFFPDSFKKSGEYRHLNSSHIMLRTEALAKLGNSSTFSNNREAIKKALVTYPEALFEKVVNATALSSNMIHIKTSEILKVDELMKRFVSLGFKREDFVYEPGQFAMRGGILDIYSFGNEHPYRIELFGNEVDSIRIFNPETQLSERKLLQVSILPNIETKFESQEKISLLDYLPPNTVFWFKDLTFTIEKLAKAEDDLTEKLPEGSVAAIEQDEQIIKQLTPEDFEQIDSWKRKLLDRHIIQWTENSVDSDVVSKDVTFIDFGTENQPVFNRNFELLIANL